MARAMTPPPVVTDSGSRHERRVWDLLVRRLSGEWRIWHDQNVDPLASQSAQLDFLVAHPRHGFAVLEAKATQWCVRRGQSYFYHRGDRAWRPVKRSPFQQARSGLMSLRKTLDLPRLRQRAEGYLPMAAGVVMLDMETQHVPVFQPTRQDGGIEAHLFADDADHVEMWLIGLLERDGRGRKPGSAAWLRDLEDVLGGRPLQDHRFLRRWVIRIGALAAMIALAVLFFGPLLGPRSPFAVAGQTPIGDGVAGAISMVRAVFAKGADLLGV